MYQCNASPIIVPLKQKPEDINKLRTKIGSISNTFYFQNTQSFSNNSIIIFLL